MEGVDIIQVFLQDKNGIYLTVSLADPSKLTKRQTSGFSASLMVDKFVKLFFHLSIGSVNSGSRNLYRKPRGRTLS